LGVIYDLHHLHQLHQLLIYRDRGGVVIRAVLGVIRPELVSIMAKVVIWISCYLSLIGVVFTVPLNFQKAKMKEKLVIILMEGGILSMVAWE
jgi:hypothetical protein